VNFISDQDRLRDVLISWPLIGQQ